MVYSLPGVEVSCNKPAAVKIFIQGDETRRHIFDWVFTVTFEVRKKSAFRPVIPKPKKKILIIASTLIMIDL